MKPDQSNFDWTLLVAFVNPGRSIDRNVLSLKKYNFEKWLV